MKILKIFGAVLAVHAVAFMLIFANPGCSSTSKPMAAAPAGPASPPAVVTVPATAAEVSPVSAASPSAGSGAIAFDPNAPAVSAVARYSPTRPGTPAASAVQAQPITDVVPATTYAVGSGDSLWTIAKKNHLTVSELAAANNLSASAKLKLGQKLIIPGKSLGVAGAAAAGEPVYKVRSGDNLALIAKRAGTTPAALKDANGLKSDTVRSGQELKLPAGATMPAAEAAPAAADTATAKPPPSGSVTHLVKPGETLGTIARKYQVKQGDIAVANNITNPALIRAGMTLVIPGWQAPKSTKAAPSAASAPTIGEPNPLLTIPTADQRAAAGNKPVPPASDVPVIRVDDTPPATPSKNP